MRLSELRADIGNFLGQVVEVEGYFVLVGQVGYLVDSEQERHERKNGLKINLANLKKVMMAHVPPWGGSKYYYADDAVVVGRLEVSDDVEFAYRLSDVKTMRITRHGMTFVAVP
jgi:hypothetical protein